MRRPGIAESACTYYAESSRAWLKERTGAFDQPQASTFPLLRFTAWPIHIRDITPRVPVCSLRRRFGRSANPITAHSGTRSPAQPFSRNPARQILSALPSTQATGTQLHSTRKFVSLILPSLVILHHINKAWNVLCVLFVTTGPGMADQYIPVYFAKRDHPRRRSARTYIWLPGHPQLAGCRTRQYSRPGGTSFSFIVAFLVFGSRMRCGPKNAA
jgi:hypothetical protein